MCVTELDNFVKKFHQLWKAGATAHLDVDTHAGRAWVGLRVQLGQVPAGPVHHPVHHPPHRQRGPAYQRRLERRRAVRASSTADLRSSDTAHAGVADKQEVNETAEEARKAAEVAVNTEDASKVEETSITAGEANNSVDDFSNTSSTATDRLMIMELNKKETRPEETGLPSPIVQLDGEADEDIARFSFESTYHEDDIKELLSEIFPESEVNLALESTVKVAPLSNREIFVIRLKPTATTKKLLSWPEMENDQADVFENVKRLN